MSGTSITALRELLGDIDIYLFDQLLKGRIDASSRILDAGCGGGRNLRYLLRLSTSIYGLDPSEQAIAGVRATAASLQPGLPDDHFRVEPIEDCTFDDDAFDVVIANALLHFARDRDHFDAMLSGLWRVLAPGGMLFARLASSTGIEDRIRPLGGGRYQLPDGSDRYLVDDATLIAATRQRSGELLEPLKTVNVQGQRCMTTWVVRKPEDA